MHIYIEYMHQCGAPEFDAMSRSEPARLGFRSVCVCVYISRYLCIYVLHMC